MTIERIKDAFEAAGWTVRPEHDRGRVVALVAFTPSDAPRHVHVDLSGWYTDWHVTIDHDTTYGDPCPVRALRLAYDDEDSRGIRAALAPVLDALGRAEDAAGSDAPDYATLPPDDDPTLDYVGDVLRDAGLNVDRVPWLDQYATAIEVELARSGIFLSREPDGPIWWAEVIGPGAERHLGSGRTLRAALKQLARQSANGAEILALLYPDAAAAPPTPQPDEDSESSARRVHIEVSCASRIVHESAEHPTPTYYRAPRGEITAADVIDSWGLDYWSGSVVAHVLRAGSKPGETKLEALRNAAGCLAHAIRVEEEGE